MQFFLLIAAALSYSIGGYFMKLSEGLSKGEPTLLVLTLFCLGATLQIMAMRQREMSSTYIVVLGFEAVTALLLGIFVLGEALTMIKLLGILVVVVGVVLLRW